MDDSWDWPVLLYIGTVILKRPEGQFWRMTPRKFNALVKAHIAMNPSSDNSEDSQGSRKGFIDEVPM